MCRYMSYEEMSDYVAPRGVRYLAGWGYVLSRDVVEHLLRAVDSYSRHPETQPGVHRAVQLPHSRPHASSAFL